MVQLDPQPRPVGNFQISLAVDLELFDGDAFNVVAGGEVFDVAGHGHGGGQLQVGGEADRGVPAVRDHQHVVVERVPADFARLADPPVLGAVGLDDVHRPPLDPGDERLPAGQ